MKLITSIFCFFMVLLLEAQTNLPQDYLSAEFHKGRREALRNKMPDNSVAVFFANAIRNRSNDVDYVYHQDPDFYYLTGYKEPHAVLIIFSDNQIDEIGKKYNEVIYVQENDPRSEMWTGKRLGIEGTIGELSLAKVFNGIDFFKNEIDFNDFNKVLHKPIIDDYRDNPYKMAESADMIAHFRTMVQQIPAPIITNDRLNVEINQEISSAPKNNIDTKSLSIYMGALREIKTVDELKLLKKAVRISAMAQIEVMKAMHIGMSETEIQGLHEYVYKKYGSEYEGYPSIVGAGNNGCVLHYVENSKTKVDNALVLMDLGAEYHGYTADVTRTIPANGKFNKEQRAIYDLVYAAQEAGIAKAIIGNTTSDTHLAGKVIINKGLFDLGIISSINQNHMFFPHGTSHHIGLDVHDLSNYGAFKENMVITVEPGIYIPEGSDCDKKWWGIAVRIEDDILITENGPINLSAEAPRKSEDIETLMREPSIFDKFHLPNLD